MNQLVFLFFITAVVSPLYFKRFFLQKAHLILRLIVAAIYGNFLAITLAMPIISILHSGLPPDYKFFSFDIGVFAQVVAGVIILMFFGLIFMLPLLLIALPVALFFKKKIEESPVAWCILATGIASLLSATFFYFTSSIEREFFQILFSSSVYLIFSGMLMASIVFCYLNPSKIARGD